MEEDSHPREEEKDNQTMEEEKDSQPREKDIEEKGGAASVPKDALPGRPARTNSCLCPAPH